MKNTMNLIKTLNESVDEALQADYEEFKKQIKFLIEDEKEAIEGYQNAIKVLEDKMTDYQNNEIYATLSHIIGEEEEHIEELEKLQSDIDITSWK